jgi:hypothetical protein
MRMLKWLRISIYRTRMTILMKIAIVTIVTMAKTIDRMTSDRTTMTTICCSTTARRADTITTETIVTTITDRTLSLTHLKPVDGIKQALRRQLVK